MDLVTLSAIKGCVAVFYGLISLAIISHLGKLSLAIPAEQWEQNGSVVRPCP